MLSAGGGVPPPPTRRSAVIRLWAAATSRRIVAAWASSDSPRRRRPVLTARASWPPWHRKYDADFAAAGFQPRVVQRATSPQHLLALVAAGVGVTRLPMSSSTLRDGGVAFVPLTGEAAAVALVTRAGDDNPVLDALRDVLHEVAHEVLGA